VLDVSASVAMPRTRSRPDRPPRAHAAAPAFAELPHDDEHPFVIRKTSGRLARMDARYRCRSCGNLTRFDVTVTRRTREYHHFSVAGDLEVGELLAERIEEVACRWCGAVGDAIEVEALEGSSQVEERVGEP
jgi:hypothetical protein